MCICILSQANTTIPKEHLINSFNHNDDGAGFMYAENDELHIEKGFMDFDSFYAAYKPHENKPIAVHFRITTHGNSDEANTHPFQVGRHLGMIHNGVIQAVDRPDKTKSDTYWFNEKILVPVYKRDSRFIFKEHFKELIKEYIGWSKLVFLNNKGHHTIINEDKGIWDEGVWYSNTSYKQSRQTHTQTGGDTRRIAPFCEPKKEDKPDIFTVGSRVEVRYEFNKANNGFGIIDHFTGGQMVGVKMEGQQGVRLIHMSFLYLAPPDNPFEVGNWVVRTDSKDPDKIGEVQGTVGDGVVVWWLNDMGVFTGPNHVVNASKLQLWWDTAEEYMQ